METAFLITRLGALSLSHCIIGSLSRLCIFLLAAQATNSCPNATEQEADRISLTGWQWMDERANQNVESEVKICFALSSSCIRTLFLSLQTYPTRTHSHTHSNYECVLFYEVLLSCLIHLNNDTIISLLLLQFMFIFA